MLDLSGEQLCHVEMLLLLLEALVVTTCVRLWPCLAEYWGQAQRFGQALCWSCRADSYAPWQLLLREGGHLKGPESRMGWVDQQGWAIAHLLFHWEADSAAPHMLLCLLAMDGGWQAFV